MTFFSLDFHEFMFFLCLRQLFSFSKVDTYKTVKRRLQMTFFRLISTE
jgi:hypothetical protein